MFYGILIYEATELMITQRWGGHWDNLGGTPLPRIYKLILSRKREFFDDKEI